MAAVYQFSSIILPQSFARSKTRTKMPNPQLNEKKKSTAAKNCVDSFRINSAIVLTIKAQNIRFCFGYSVLPNFDNTCNINDYLIFTCIVSSIVVFFDLRRTRSCNTPVIYVYIIVDGHIFVTCLCFVAMPRQPHHFA